MKTIDDKIQDMNNLATKTTLNAKTNEVKGKIPSINNLVTKLLLMLLKEKYLVLVV